MASKRPLTWRIQSIPADFTEERLKSCFHTDDKKCIEIKSLAPDVTNYDGDGTLTATILFSPQEPREPRAEEHSDFDIDKDFIGFTPLNNPGKDVCADIITVTGLAGHAFGSWAHSAEKMWLRDYLPQGVKNQARILIYGYESQLKGPNTAGSIISDYANSFAQSLIDIRDHPSCRYRPLILIGHSLGALIIKQAITDIAPGMRSRLPVRAVIFFGAPHNGLEVTALETLVKGRPTQTLISELKPESPTLTGLSERFRYVAGDVTIHTYYESRPTFTVAKGPDGNWERCGEATMMVKRSSALLNFELEKTRMKVDGDHKEIARLRRGQASVYPSVLRVIKEALVSATAAMTRAVQAVNVEAEKETVNEPDLRPTPLSTGEDIRKMPGLGNPSIRVRGRNPPITFDQNTFGQNTTTGKLEYDNDNLICDSCFSVFPKTLMHRHCFVCEDGNYNICYMCEKSGVSCPGRHNMVSRRLAYGMTYVKRTNWDDGGNQCEVCGFKFSKFIPSFSCNICESKSSGNLEICIPCRKSGHICVRGHILKTPIKKG